MKYLTFIFFASLSVACIADTFYMSETKVSQTTGGQPLVVQEAALKEAIRQNTTWTSENIQANPYLFLTSQIEKCDKLKTKIEAQNITLIRMEKQATRKAEDAASTIKRYTKFLEAAKVAYQTAEEDDSWPAVVNGYEMDEEKLSDKIADALERVELAKVEKKSNTAIVQKVKIRKGDLKIKKRELVSIRRKLVQQAEQVKMNKELGEIAELKDVLGTINDLMIGIDEDPSKLSVEDLIAEDPNEKRNKAVSDFLSK